MRKINFKVKYTKTNDMELILTHAIYVDEKQDTMGSVVERVLSVMEEYTINFLKCVEYIYKSVVMESDLEYLKGLKLSLDNMRTLGNSEKYLGLLGNVIADYINETNVCNLDMDYMAEWEQIEYTQKTLRKLTRNTSGREFYEKYVKDNVKDNIE